jgi:hypothetical protein
MKKLKLLDDWRGAVVLWLWQKTHDREETIFQAPFNWIKAWNKNSGKLYPGIVACAVILQMGGWNLGNGWLIKSSYMAQNES